MAIKNYHREREMYAEMKKAIVIAIVLVLALAVTPLASADAHESPVLYGNAQSGSISFGSHGYSWYSEDSTGPAIPEMVVLEPEVVVKGIFQDSSGKIHYYFVPGDTAPVIVKGAYRDKSDTGTDSALIWDFDRDGQWEFYKDSRGVLHYFYVDPDRSGEYQRYTDKNGVTQYHYVYTGWKTE